MNGAMDGGNAQRDVHRPNSKLKHRYDDSLEECMSRGEGKHEATKLIPIDESVRLLQIQKHKQEVCTTNVFIIVIFKEQLILPISSFYFLFSLLNFYYPEMGQAQTFSCIKFVSG